MQPKQHRKRKSGEIKDGRFMFSTKKLRYIYVISSIQLIEEISKLYRSYIEEMIFEV
jgi:hypothetical protein